MIDLIRNLKQMGVFWIGFTGGEPLLNKTLRGLRGGEHRLCREALHDRMHTHPATCSRSEERGALFGFRKPDHWNELEHDQCAVTLVRSRRAESPGDLQRRRRHSHGCVSVLSRQMIQQHQTDEYIAFSWRWDSRGLAERSKTINTGYVAACLGHQRRGTDRVVRAAGPLQQRSKITVNYLGHFEGKEHLAARRAQDVYVMRAGM